MFVTFWGAVVVTVLLCCLLEPVREMKGAELKSVSKISSGPNDAQRKAVMYFYMEVYMKMWDVIVPFLCTS